jgi:O-antigen/teichoic acid export membrane protein
MRRVTLNRVVITILQLVQLVILGRILGPQKYGLIAMVMMVTGFAQAVTNMGLSSAVIQRNDPTEKELSTLYWINVVAGFLMFGIVCLLTPLFAHVFNSSEIESLLPVAALVLAKSIPKWMLYWNLALVIIVPPIIYSSSLGGQLIHVALALTGLQAVLLISHYWVFIRKLIGHCFTEYMHAMVRPAFVSILMAVIVLVFSFLIPDTALAMKLFVQVAAGVISYVLLSWFFQNDIFPELIENLPLRVRTFKFLKQLG